MRLIGRRLEAGLRASSELLAQQLDAEPQPRT
jgi:hypothetical protein